MKWSTRRHVTNCMVGLDRVFMFKVESVPDLFNKNPLISQTLLNQLSDCNLTVNVCASSANDCFDRANSGVPLNWCYPLSWLCQLMLVGFMGHLKDADKPMVAQTSCHSA